MGTYFILTLHKINNLMKRLPFWLLTSLFVASFTIAACGDDEDDITPRDNNKQENTNDSTATNQKDSTSVVPTDSTTTIAPADSTTTIVPTDSTTTVVPTDSTTTVAPADSTSTNKSDSTSVRTRG